MSDLWTRERVERELSDHVAYLPSRVAAALLAGAECQECHLYGSRADCLDCHGTGYTQSALARAMAALQGAGT